MNIKRVSVAALFLAGSVALNAQVANDTIRKSEKSLEGVQLKGNISKKTETAVLQEVKKSVVQKQAIGAEEISRKGISNVEQGLTKVTGITTVEGKGLFVRGLEERYNTLLINGLASPSNNPFQKIIALKQFPTDVVGKLNIYKTFNSNLYADFAGATFDIETLGVERPFTKIEFSLGLNTRSSLRDGFKISPNANTMRGYIGLNSYDRQLPGEVKGMRPSGYQFNMSQSLNSFGEDWNVEKIKSLPNSGIGFTTAQKFKAGETGTVGMLLSLNQGNKYEIKDGSKNTFRFLGTSIGYNNKLNRTEYNYGTESSALLGINYKNKGTNVSFGAMFLQNSDNFIQNYKGYRNGEEDNIQFLSVNQMDISRFTDLQLIASQKIGERHLVKAGASWVNNNYQQPDRKIMYGQETGNNNDIVLTYGGNNLIRQYLDVKGSNYLSAFAEYSVFLGEKGDRKDYPWQVALGYNGFEDIRNTSYRFIFSTLDIPSMGTVRVDKDKPQSVFVQSLAQGVYNYKEGSTSVYKTNMYQFVNAGYINVNYKPNDLWDILVGGRVENNMNLTRYKELSTGINDPFLNLTRNQYYILPSLAVKYAASSRSNIRFAASKTITRPILIEYMPIEYINPDNENLVGNPNLVNSENYNIDLKYEVYPTSKEMYAVNLFAKKIDNAIERSYIASGNSNGSTITFYNAKTATLAGVELEGIFALSRLSESLNQWTLGANATFMYSDVETGAEQAGETDAEAGRNRALQGASPWVINADLKYEYKNRNNLPSTVSLVYNVSGKKIFGVGFSKMDNVYEMPFHQLDLIYNTQLNKNWNVKLGLLNLLNSEYRLEQGKNSLVPFSEDSSLLENYKKGTTFNLSVGYTF